MVMNSFTVAHQNVMALRHDVAFPFCTAMVCAELAKLQLSIPPEEAANWREIFTATSATFGT
jgi:hypothetical protein